MVFLGNNLEDFLKNLAEKIKIIFLKIVKSEAKNRPLSKIKYVKKKAQKSNFNNVVVMNVHVYSVIENRDEMDNWPIDKLSNRQKYNRNLNYPLIISVFIKQFIVNDFSFIVTQIYIYFI